MYIRNPQSILYNSESINKSLIILGLCSYGDNELEDLIYTRKFEITVILYNTHWIFKCSHMWPKFYVHVHFIAFPMEMRNFSVHYFLAF